MSSLYLPDSAILNATRWVSRLSQRDLSLQIPVNFVTHPGVSVQAACFAHNRYEDVAAGKCISNLIVSGFRRLDVDVFWDASRSQWSLCPVELELGNGDGVTDSILTSSSSVSATAVDTAATLSNDIITGRNAPAPLALAARQDAETLSAESSPTVGGTEATSRTLTTSTLGPTPSSISSAGGQDDIPDDHSGDATLVQVGPYLCSPSMDLTLLIGILVAHIANTETVTNATTSVLTLNVRAAAPASDPAGSAQAPLYDDLPEGSSLISSIIARNASTYLYTPSDLLQQRQNLNSSMGWFVVPSSVQPNAAYFEVDPSGSSVSSPNGWPSESFLELELNKRLMVTFGDIDPQMQSYNFGGDADTIFPTDYLAAIQNVTTTSDGNITEGCLFNLQETLLADTNSSWAISYIRSGVAAISTPLQLDFVLALASNLTFCGISPILNFTLNNATADQSWEPYKAFAESTIWSWGAGQPSNVSGSEDFNDSRCAAMNSTSGLWQASDCSESRYGACRIGTEPYRWQISSSDTPYDRVHLGCDDDTSFDVPRTALENSHLLSVWRAYQNEHRDDDLDPLLWLDFNDLDIATCWVVGRNSTCPYQEPDTTVRNIVVPVVGGVVVFALTALTICVKCAGNRQTAKRRKRRGDDGWDYEGVPQ